MKRSSIYDLSSLIAECKAGIQPEFLFFWAPNAHRKWGVGKECFSQWWSAPFEVEDIRYFSAEHFMMAEKALLFGDFEIRERILSSDSPEKAKQLGRKVNGFDEKIWALHRVDIVLRGNIAKFQQNPALREYLLGTGDQVLVEASPFDSIWGIGIAEDDLRALMPEKWSGLNLLGFTLMQVRSQLIGAGSQ